MDDVAITSLRALQSTASLLSVSLSFSPVEVGIARTDCQTVDVLLCLYCLVLLVCVLVEWYEITLKLVFGLAKECVQPVDRLLYGSVRVALKTWTCMTECTSKLKYKSHFSLWTVCFLSTLLLRSLLLFYLLLEVSFSLFLVVNLSVSFGWNGFWLDGDGDGFDRWSSVMSLLTWTGPPYVYRGSPWRGWAWLVLCLSLPSSCVSVLT